VTVPLHVKQRWHGQHRLYQARSVTNEAVIENLRLFVAERTGRGQPRRAYGRWPKWVVSLSTVANRFGTWSHVVALACAR
jgi:hypothetical protein